MTHNKLIRFAYCRSFDNTSFLSLVKLKRDFLDTARASERVQSSTDGGFGDAKSDENKKHASLTLSGAEWYNQQAHRAVNQAIGRVIRHRNDYGAVLFLDHRFSEPRNSQGLSKWLRSYLLDESFGASTRSMVRFFKEAKAKSDASRARPVLQYEEPSHQAIRTNSTLENQVTQIAVVSSAAEGDEATDAFIPNSRIHKRIDLNHPSSKTESAVASVAQTDTDANVTNTLADAYSKGKPSVKSLPNIRSEEGPSIWDDLDSKPSASIGTFRTSSFKLKGQSTVQRRNEDSKQMAKVFFDTAKQILSKSDLLKVQKLLVAMKTHGGELLSSSHHHRYFIVLPFYPIPSPDKNASQAYISTAKELLVLLAGVNQHDQKRVKLISLLYPLLPMKFRYTLEKLGRQLCFQKSKLYGLCKSTLTQHDFETIRKIIPQMITDQSFETSAIDTSNDRLFLEDSHKVLSILAKSNLDPTNLFVLLPERHARKAQAMNIEIAKVIDVAKSKQLSMQKKGENSVNAVLFQKSKPRSFVPSVTEQPEEEDTKNLAQALSQGKAINDERKSRVITQQIRSQDNKRNISLPHDTTASSKRVKSASKNSDAVDLLMKQVKNDVFEPRVERLNRKIKANVPKNVICSLCSTYPKEVSIQLSCVHLRLYFAKHYYSLYFRSPCCRNVSILHV